MSDNPFDHDNARVLAANDAQQRLWPAFTGVPVDRPIIYGEADPAPLMDYIEPNRAGIRPRSPHDRMAAGGAFTPTG